MKNYSTQELELHILVFSRSKEVKRILKNGICILKRRKAQKTNSNIHIIYIGIAINIQKEKLEK